MTVFYSLPYPPCKGPGHGQANVGTLLFFVTNGILPGRTSLRNCASLTRSVTYPGSSPRVWGHLRHRLDRHARVIGSSPRVWGHLLARRSFVSADRFIPTRVGTSHDSARCRRWFTVHPHACGDIMLASVMASHVDRFIPTRVGTSQAVSRRRCWRSRFIPTRVGTSECRC